MNTADNNAYTIQATNSTLYNLIKTPNGKPIYITDDYETLERIQSADKYNIDIINKALKAPVSLFDFPINTKGTPVIILNKRQSNEVNEVYNILKNAGVTVFFQDANRNFETITSTDLNEIRQELIKQYQANFSAGGTIAEFKNIINSSANTPAIKTGFPVLDKVLDGGLYEGLYAIGAISSLGKTTFCLNIAEQIAISGHDVIIIALEMGKHSLIGRSISRLTYLQYKNNPEQIKFEWCKTSRGITDGSRYKNYNDNEKKLINNAIDYYAQEIGQHLYIYEAFGDLTAERIQEIVIKHMAYTGNRPILIVDYLQLIQHKDPHINGNDKIRTDFNLTKLKQLSRDFKLPIIAISSFNRTGYSTEVKLECFKESGGIDYTCDVIMGLQLAGVGGANFDVNEAKKKDPREIELVFLKNREAAVGDLIKYYYYPKFNHFEESAEDVRAQREYEAEQAKAAKEKAKQSKAEATKLEHAEIVEMAYNACVENGTALITDMVDFLGGHPVYKTLERYIKATGKYKVVGNKVIKK